MILIFGKVKTNMFDEKKIDLLECYKKPLQYDATACERCQHEMKCYEVFLKFMSQNEKPLW